MGAQQSVLESSPEEVYRRSSAMHVFLSYSAADHKFAERLREELRRHGLSVWIDKEDLKPGSEWQQQIQDAIRSADDILVLVGSQSTDDPTQQLTWQAALEAVWQDPHKRLIPVLLRDAPLPAFVYADSSGVETRVVLFVNPRDLSSTVSAILLALQRNGVDNGASNSVPIPDSVEIESKGTQAYELEEARSDRLLEIKQHAERLKH